MPATQVSPYMRRKISDEARMLLLSALGYQAVDFVNVRALPMPQRIQNFKGQIRIEIPGSEGNRNGNIRLRIIVLQQSYLIRYQLESREMEVSIYNKTGALTTWITLEDGQTRQLRTYLTSEEAPIEICREVTCLLEILEQLDLYDLFAASHVAFPLFSSGATTSHDTGVAGHQEIYSGISTKNAYTFVFDTATGVPVSVTQRALHLMASTDASTSSDLHQLLMFVEQYYRFDGSIDVPTGIKSDMDLMVDIAMTCYSQWSFAGQQCMVQVFDAMDLDRDGVVSSLDVQHQLLTTGHPEQQAMRMVAEMVRLLCDTNGDPLDEFHFYQFCGFWMIMLIDGYRISDPANEVQLVTAMQRLFGNH